MVNQKALLVCLALSVICVAVLIDQVVCLDTDEQQNASFSTDGSEMDDSVVTKLVMKRRPGWGKRSPGWGKRAPAWGKRAPAWGKRTVEDDDSTDDQFVNRVRFFWCFKNSAIQYIFNNFDFFLKLLLIKINKLLDHLEGPQV
jgi:hypothetical protein